MHIKLQNQLIVTWESLIQFKFPIFEPYHILKKKKKNEKNKQTNKPTQPNKKHQASLENTELRKVIPCGTVKWACSSVL